MSTTYAHGRTRTRLDALAEDLAAARGRIRALERSRDAAVERGTKWKAKAEQARAERDQAVETLTARIRVLEDANARFIAEAEWDGPTAGKARLEAAAAEVRYFEAARRQGAAS